MNELPSLTYLKECLDYNPETGIFRWKERPESHFKSGEIGSRKFKSRLAGKEAGSLTGSGHLLIRIDGQQVFCHRLAWLFGTGKWPTALVDHEDRNPTNNVFGNLREATKSKNGINRQRPRNNESGRMGVAWDESRNLWMAYIGVEGKRINLGRFPSKNDAISARNEAEKRYFGAFSPISWVA